MLRKKLTIICVLLLWALPWANALSAELPVEHFFRNFEFTRVTLSPDGKYLAAIAPVGESRNLVVVERGTKKPVAVTTLTKKDVAGYAWASDTRLVFYLEEDGNESFGINAVNFDGSQPRTLTRAERGITVIPRYTRMIDRLKDDDEHVLVINNERKRLYPDVYRLNIYTGRMRRITTNPGNITGWITDHDGKVRLAVKEEVNAERGGILTTILYRSTEESDWVSVLDQELGDEPVTPVGFAADDRTLYLLSARGRDKQALYTFDPETKRWGDLIFAHEEYDVSGPNLSRLDHRLLSVDYFTEKPRVHYVDPGMKRIQEQIDAAMPDTVNTIYGWTEDETLALVSAASDRTPGKVFLLERDPLKLTYLLSRAERFKPGRMAKMEPVRFEARDGLEIHGYLTRPVDAGEGPFPLILHPHGGPYGVRDYWGFNREIQFLANRGYAVLQVNFRGSGGYGHRFQVGAWKQWGLQMQDDLTDAVRWAVDNRVADPKRVCVYGASYGGYAAMAGVTTTPDLYKCAINYVGVVDLPMLYEDWTSRRSDPSGLREAWIKRAIGDPGITEERHRMKETSPLNHVDKIRVPLMVVHGRRDPRVDVDQATELIAALEKHGKPFVKLIKTKEGHGFRREENVIELYTLMDAFLKENL